MAKKSEQMTYGAAIGELERIVAEIEGENVDVDALAEKVKRASVLIAFCRGRLRETEVEVKNVLADIEDKAASLAKDVAADDDEEEYEEDEPEEEVSGKGGGLF
jgi:exodeoxyribonuclease VII small subunit